MTHPHPWRDLRSLTSTLLHWRDHLPGGVRGGTDGQDVWMLTGMSQVQRRCTLVHELVHLGRGHEGCQPDDVERSVKREAARRLVPDGHRIADAMAWARGHVPEAASELWVTTEVLEHRLAALHPAERALLARRMADVLTWA